MIAVLAAMQAAMIASQADSRSLDKTRAQAAIVPAQMQECASPPSQPEQASAQVQAAASPPSQPEPAADASKPVYPEIDL